MFEEPTARLVRALQPQTYSRYLQIYFPQVGHIRMTKHCCNIRQGILKERRASAGGKPEERGNVHVVNTVDAWNGLDGCTEAFVILDLERYIFFRLESSLVPRQYSSRFP